MEQKTILFADDDADIREVMRVLLQGDGYEVIEARDGADAVSKISDKIDLYILDVMMPRMDGLAVCRRVREKSNAPVLFLTAKSQEQDKTAGFSAGADDYLPKPFSYAELTSRVKALLRRYYVYRGKAEQPGAVSLVIRNLTINPDTCEVTMEGRAVSLTAREYQMLLLMASNRRKVFSAQNLYESVWNEPYFYSCNNTIMVHIRNLRRKLEPKPEAPQYIKTIWGKGYCVE